MLRKLLGLFKPSPKPPAPSLPKDWCPRFGRWGYRLCPFSGRSWTRQLSEHITEKMYEDWIACTLQSYYQYDDKQGHAAHLRSHPVSHYSPEELFNYGYDIALPRLEQHIALEKARQQT